MRRMKAKRAVETVGWIVIVYLVYVGLAALFERSLFMNEVLVNPPANPQQALGPLFVRYFEHPVTVILHLIPAFLVFILGPLQFIRKFRSRWINLHRWSGRVFIASGMVAGISGFTMGTIYPFGGYEAGFNEAMAIAFLSASVFFGLVKALVHIKKRQIALHREWMIRSFALLLSVATERVIMLPIRAYTEIPFIEAFGTALWMAFVINLIMAEIWVHWTRPIQQGAQLHWKDTSEGTMEEQAAAL